MDPTQCLRDEHQVILDVLACFEVALAGARNSERTSAGEFLPFVDFFRNYADRCHHKKEEEILFPILERNGIPGDDGPIGCMLEEHRAGRAHVAAIAGAVESEGAFDLATLRSEGEAYIDLLRRHIDKENQVLFEMAGQVIQGEDAAALTRQYDHMESDADYVETIGRCRGIAERLIATYS